MEDAATGDWIAVGCIAPSPFSRDRLQSKLCDGSLIITPGKCNEACRRGNIIYRST
jgi:hypothetical protein